MAVHCERIKRLLEGDVRRQLGFAPTLESYTPASDGGAHLDLSLYHLGRGPLALSVTITVEEIADIGPDRLASMIRSAAENAATGEDAYEAHIQQRRASSRTG
ncbi:hypothetical protein CKO28_13790 [Rhodovibrio sodomensis]|uniref:Uncharacterized protein n=1 Tax=Rhodovibrio sodomensis TaxID=1088 RepID=A0ABS1DF56_9PROT|nr:hypothetical protein [Rhodovibrio sodomensis]MBK1669106.1 hypothetical protein [Rhodovibrio sodomensis]